MVTEKEFEIVKDAINKISKEDLVRFILDKINSQNQDNIPVSIFNTELSPLEAITRYLKEQNRKTKDIASILNKNPSSISESYKNSKSKIFKFKKTDSFIPLSEFQKNSKLSILEVVVQYLRNQNLKFSQIAQTLNRDPKTIWTIHNRAKKKNA